MVKRTEVMIGDIICLCNKAFEIVEIHKYSVEGKFLDIPMGIYTEAWANVKPYLLTADLLSTIGFEKVEECKDNLWCYKGTSFKVHYSIDESSLSILGNPVKIMGFSFCYISTLHELLHQFKTYNIDTVHIYKQMKKFKLRIEKFGYP